MSSAVAEQVIEATELEEWMAEDHGCEVLWGRDPNFIMCGQQVSVRARVTHACGYHAVRGFCGPCWKMLTTLGYVARCRKCTECPADLTYELL